MKKLDLKKPAFKRYCSIYPNCRTPFDVGQTLKLLRHGLEISKLEAIVGEEQEALQRFMGELERFQPRLRLVSELDPEEIALHLLEAVAISKRLRPKAKVLDIGTGGGFPALPLAVLRKDAFFILIERRQKLAAYLEHAVSCLGLGHVRILPEEYEKFEHSKDLNPIHEVTAKAVWPWRVYLRKVLPFFLGGARVWVFQTPALEEEEIGGYLRDLCGRPVSLCSLEVRLFPGGKSRRLFGATIQESNQK